MKKKVIVISIQILVVAIVLALTVTTYAWFVSQTRVDTTATTITAAAGANTFIESEEPFEPKLYKGETGQGYDGDEFDGVDAPYAVSKKLTVTFSPLGSDSAMTARISAMQIARSTGEHVSSLDTPEILDCFTWRIEIDGESYGPDKDGFICREVDGELVYYDVPEAVTVELIFKLIFLDEVSYAHWLSEEYDEVEAFAYCGYENMKAVFTATVEVGIAAHIVESGTVEGGGADE